VIMNTHDANFSGRINIEIAAATAPLRAQPPPPDTSYNFAGISINAVAATQTQASFLLTNPWDHDIIYREEFYLERFVDNEWVRVRDAAFGWDAPRQIAAGETQLISKGFHALLPGQYRIVKWFGETQAPHRAVILHGEFVVDIAYGTRLVEQRYTTHSSMHLLHWYQEDLQGATTSGNISYIPRRYWDQGMLYHSWLSNRSTVITADDIGSYRITFTNFTDGLEMIDVGLQIGFYRISTAQGLRDGGFFEFTIYPDQVGRNLLVNISNRDHPDGGRVLIDISKID